jgi:hypothetical protein
VASYLENNASIEWARVHCYKSTEHAKCIP